MKGEIFSLFEQFVVQNWGFEAFETIYDKVHGALATKEPFVGPGTYPDRDFFVILRAATEEVGVPIEEAVFQFGRFCFPRLAAKLPHHTASFFHPKPFLMSIHDIIHTEVRKVYEGAAPPTFEFVDLGPSALLLRYRSKRKMYSFVEGLIQGAAEYFEVSITCNDRRETNATEGECEFVVTFGSL